MADAWDEFPDAPTARTGADAFAEFADAPARTVKASTIGPGGKKITFDVPEGADDATVRKLAAAATKDKRYSKATIAREDREPVGTATDDSALSGFAAGVMKPIDKAAEWLGNTGVGKSIDQFGVSLGLPSSADAIAQNEAARSNNNRTGYQLLGNIAGTAAATRGRGLLTGGAISGGLLTDSHDAAGTLQDAAIGAGSSLVVGKTLQGLGSLATGVKDKGAKLLAQAGVPMTLGQIGRAAGGFMGNAAGKIEDMATSIPGIGDLITLARDRGIKAINTAAGNRILANVGEKVPKGIAPGHDTVDAVEAALSNRYKSLVPKLKGQYDQQFAQDLSDALDLVPSHDLEKTFAKDLWATFGKRAPGSTISAQALKDAESNLTKLIGKYGRSTGNEARYGEALEAVRDGLRGLVVRNNPDQAAELQALNTGWAQLKGLKQAIRTGSDQTKASGIVTPGGAMRASTRAGFRDPLMEAATRILPSRVPDSGTAGRLTLGILGGGAAAGGLGVDPREHPIATGALLAIGGANTRAGQTALSKLAFGSRPALVSAAGEAAKKLSRYAPQLVAPAAVSTDR